MEKLFVPYEIAVLAKENRFDEDCLAFYLGNTPTLWFHNDPENEGYKFGDISTDLEAPLYQQLVDWLWLEHKILIAPYIIPYTSDLSYTVQQVNSRINFYKTKELAIKEALNLIS